MTSAALDTWKTGRASRLDRLEDAHAAVYGTGDGGRRLASGLNRALILQLAAEFQGFARDLHDEARYALVGELAAGDGQRQEMLNLVYTKNRRLTRGNAEPSTLNQDFGLFNIRLWNDLQRHYPRRGLQWHDRLALLNEARNGVAHADDQKAARVAATGWLLTLRSVRRWRGTLNGLAIGMDRVVGEHLRRNLGVRAW